MQLVLKLNRFHEIWTQLTKLWELLAQVEKFRPGPLHGRRERHPHEAHRVEKNLINLTYSICFISIFSRPTDMNWFHECPS